MDAMLQELQNEIDAVFNLEEGILTPEITLNPSDLHDIARLDFGKNTHLMGMLFLKEQRNRYLVNSMKYACTHEEPVFFSPLPFDGPYHRHTSYELIYVVSGSFTVIMSGREITINEGEAQLMDLNCVHFDRNLAADATVLYLHFAPDLFHTFTDSTGKDMKCTGLLSSEKDDAQRYIHYHPGTEDNMCRTEHLFAELIREVNREAYGSREMLSLLACRLLQHLERSYIAEAVTLPGSLQKDLFLIEVDRYIQENLSTVTVSELAKQFHFNPDYFNRKIKQVYTVTLTEYLQRKRIEKARQLLSQSSLPVMEVMTRTGYRNTRYFYEIFKKATGLTPAAYRAGMTP